MKLILTLMLFACALVSPAYAATDSGLGNRIADIQHRWARISYQMPEGQRADAFDKLEKRADALTSEYPDRVEPRVWKAIVLSSHAAVAGPFSALKMAERARDLLLEAEQKDPTALNGSIPTSLGTLYAKVPGWPLGFGSDDKARAYFHKALKVNPDGLDPNYFYGQFLYDQGDYRGALEHLRKALDAPDRPGRPLADKGRRQQARALMAKAQSELGSHDAVAGFTR